MNNTLKYLGLLVILPLFTVALTTNIVVDVEGTKSRGGEAAGRISPKSYGSNTAGLICGDVLCSEYPGGRDAFQQSMKSPTTFTQKEQKQDTDKTEKDAGSVLKLSRANVPATIPMHKGYYNGESVYYIITDSSDPTHAEIITENQDWKVELAPLLKRAPQDALSTTYMFTNGIEGNGVHGFQGEVFTSTPAQKEKYSALTAHVHVTWNDGATPRVLDSEEAIKEAEENGEVSLQSLPVVLNMPQIVWPGGQMKINEAKKVTDDLAYGGGQVLEIDKEEMTVTFIAHRGWGPDGRTIYYIVTDATPKGPADMMGVVDAPVNAKLINNAAAVDLFQFANGIKGTGPLGFQPGIAASGPGDKNYSPMWRIFMIGWENEENAQLLETMDDISAYKKQGLINVNIAKPMDSDHIVNCPFIDPFQ